MEVTGHRVLLVHIMVQLKSIPVIVLSKAWVCQLSLAGTMSLNPANGHRDLSLVSVVFCQVEVSASDRLLVQRTPIECGVSIGSDGEMEHLK